MHRDIQHILKSTFGYDSFRQNQEDIIQRTISGKDSLVIMPTCGGKSVCFQIPAIAMKGMTIVVSPLIALMNDQVLNLEQAGVRAAALHSNMSSEEKMDIERSINNGEIKLLYMSPERINNPNVQDYISRQNINLIAIDEAHCVSVWGNDFRPDYVALGLLKKKIQNVPFLALTATADTATQKDICKQLNLHEPVTFLSSFERSNITTYAYPGQRRKDRIASILRNFTEDSGIVYCLSRKETENIAAYLNSMGLNAQYYHAGMSGEDRYRVQRSFQNDEVRIICATVAFGMGIDKPNIRFVIHYNMPKNLEAYYQEIGRAGRDGLPSEAHMFYSWGDFLMLKNFVDDSDANQDFKEVQLAKLSRMWEYASTTDCRTLGILAYFGEYKNEGCGHCDNCIHPPIKKDGLQEAQKVLSAIMRGKQTLGIEMIIDVLRGSQKYEIRERGLDRIRTFGAGREHSRLQWKNYIVQLINQGVIGVNYSKGSVLEWTPKSQDAIQGNIEIKLADYAPTKKVEKIKKVQTFFDVDVDHDLLERLKVWRSDIAKEKNVPAYIVFGNKVLEGIAAQNPKSEMELLQVSGIGKMKLEMYGDDILQIVRRQE